MPHDNTNSGALFHNNKGDNDRRPDYKGKLDVEGKEYSIAGWERIAKSGTTYISIKVSEPYNKDGNSSQDNNNNQDKEDIPF